jgi:hypothetical protein
VEDEGIRDSNKGEYRSQVFFLRVVNVIFKTRVRCVEVIMEILTVDRRSCHSGARNSAILMSTSHYAGERQGG